MRLVNRVLLFAVEICVLVLGLILALGFAGYFASSLVLISGVAATVCGLWGRLKASHLKKMTRTQVMVRLLLFVLLMLGLLYILWNQRILH